jgi:hypothetical protein
MKDIHRALEADGLNGAVRVPVVLVDDLEDTCTGEAAKDFHIQPTIPELRVPERPTHLIVHLIREPLEVPPARPDAEERFHVPVPRGNGNDIVDPL